MAFTFFGVQVAVQRFYGDTLRSRLHQAITQGQSAQSLADKRTFWKGIVALLSEATPLFAYGTWDLIRTDAAEAEFETWCSEIEGSLAEAEGAPERANRLSNDKKFVLCTAVFLVERDSNSDKTLGERCDLREADYFTRATFAHLLATIPLLNFATVQADAVYLVPGSDDGLSEDELRGEGYQYLKPLG